MPRLTLSMLLVSCLLFVIGCGNGDLATLTGNVTVDGEQAPAGIALEFSPIEGGSPSYAVTNEDGGYVAEYTFNRKGIEPGEHRVKLYPGGGETTGRQKMPEPGSESNTGRGEVPVVNFPRSYYSEVMKLTIKPGSNKITIPLETEK